MYKDLDLDFKIHPNTKNLNILSESDAVKRSIRNLVMLQPYDKPFQPDINSNIRNLLFETVSNVTANLIRRHITDVISNYEPRAEISEVIVKEEIDRNAYDVTVYFNVTSVPELLNINIILDRIR